MPPRRTPDQWQKLMEQFDSSGKTREQFCHSKGIALATFAMWRRKLRATALVAAPPAFVQVELPREAEFISAESHEPPDLVVELPYGVILRFRGLAR